MVFLQLLINGLIAGSLNALVAAGFSLIYSTNRFVHFAHGAVAAVAAYIIFAFTVRASWPFVPSLVLTVVLTGLLGFVIFYGVYYPLRRKKSSNAILLIASIALMFLLENVLLLIFGASVQSLNTVPVQTGVDIGGASITPLQIIIIATAIALSFILWLAMRYSKFGKLMRAVADNPELAETSGVNTFRVQAWSFALGSVLAAVAGILIALELNMTPSMGTNWAVRGFTSSVVGGITSVPGAILGGYLLGLVENFGIWYLPSGWKEGIAFAVLLIFLLIRPQGILGIRRSTR